MKGTTAMRITRLVVPALASMAALLASDAGAVSTRSFTTATYRELDEGETERALITSLGEVMPGQATERVDLETSAIWSAARAGDGTVYAGSIADGNIYAVNGDKKRIVATLDKDVVAAWSKWADVGALGKQASIAKAGTYTEFSSVWSAYFRPLLAQAMVGEAPVDQVMKDGAQRWTELKEQFANR